uniref:Monocarboxylate transporter 13-like n=1 Tax=Diabrotica virgifera virgifera TaxID=50390 RepID=A0A6P7FN41_DIAVI
MIEDPVEDGQPHAPLVKISEVAPSVESLKDSLPETDNFNNSTLRIDHLYQRRESILSSEISLFIEKTGQKIPDGGWGWLVVLASFVINMLSDGVGFTFGLLYKEFLIEFGASKSATSWIGSLFMSLPLIAGPIGSALVDKYGCMSMTIIGGIICTIGLALSSYARTIGVMYLTFGVIGGLGLTLCFVTAVVSIAFWFEKKRTIALGLAASGTGFGTAVYSPLATWLLFEYGWRGTLLITAGFFANMCVCGALMRDPDWIIEEEIVFQNWYDEFLDILKDLTNFSLFLDLHFFILSLSTVIVDMWYVVPYYYLAEHMTRHGYSDNEAAFVISVIGITNTIGMVLLGAVGNRLNIAKSYAICLVLCGVSIGCMILVTSSYILLLVSGGCFGLFFASSMCLTPSLLAELVSLDDFTMAYGLLLLSQGVGTLIGPPLAGWLFDFTGSWDQSFYQACIWIIVSGLLVGIIPYTKNRRIGKRS